MQNKILTLLIILLPFSALGKSAVLTQNIRGRVIDKSTKSPLPGATIILLDSKPLRGTVSNADGRFSLEQVPVGRQGLQISYIGYQPVVFPNLNVSTGKEIIVEAELEELITRIEGAEIRANEEKADAINSMAMVSARTFSIEESQRFAGARNDVARMATNFAGVGTANDAVNDIVIRGNSPNGLLWRLEGIEIPNPNHFGFMGQTGGPVNMLNNNVLSNSDFYTAAFPAEYGNALSGVFDLKMRPGNTEHHEFLGQIGLNGFELGAEGPLKAGTQASYLINFRYSTLGVFKALGINFGTGTALPEYQDLSFKLSLPAGKSGRVDIFGLGGTSQIDLITSTLDSAEAEENFYDMRHLDIYNNNKMGVAGIRHTLRFSDKTWSSVTLAATHITNGNTVDSLRKSGELIMLQQADFRSNNYLVNAQLNHKFNNRVNARFGLNYRILDYRLDNSTYLQRYDDYFPLFDESGQTSLTEAYTQVQYRPSDRLSINAGVHSQRLGFQEAISFEPRLGLQFTPSANQRFTLGYGMHAQMHGLMLYFNRVDLSPTLWEQPNKDLAQTRAHHIVLGYARSISPTLHFKAEAYYQYITDAVAEQSPSSFSMLNNSAMNWNIPDSLDNDGKGENYGIDLTFEKFMDHGFYYLFTASAYRSHYQGSDEIRRSTAFDGKYVMNLLGGKEWALGSSSEDKQQWLSFDTRVSAAGGQRYTPVDIDASIAAGETVYETENAFSRKFRDYFRWDARIAYRIDRPKFSHEWAVDIQNLTNRENPLYMIFDAETKTEKTVSQLKLFPVMQYRITF
ncbi:MAG: TonB-dependent receptor [Bacteroidales bacterium]|nr:TonB-dependent receptor [Bacteroidales bacterium]